MISWNLIPVIKITFYHNKLTLQNDKQFSNLQKKFWSQFTECLMLYFPDCKSLIHIRLQLPSCFCKRTSLVFTDIRWALKHCKIKRIKAIKKAKYLEKHNIWNSHKSFIEWIYLHNLYPNIIYVFKWKFWPKG